MSFTEKEALEYQALPVEERSRNWVGWTKRSVEKLLTLPKIDNERAVRGIIVGDICGDATNGLHALIMLAQAPRDDEVDNMIKEGVKDTWLKSDGAIVMLGQHLPERCKKAFDDLHDKYRPFIFGVIEGTIANGEDIIEGGRSILSDYGSIHDSPPDMHTDDIKYALHCLRPDYFI